MSDKKQKEGVRADDAQQQEVRLCSYAYSPWKTGRSKKEQKELLEIQEIRIPDGIEELGNYTFYGCRNLRTLKFTDTVKSIGGGSFTGCTALRNLEVLMGEENPSCIRDVVSETFHEIYVSISFRNTGKRAELIFPEYYEEGVENTPARILETHFHGCGYKYRQCFSDKKVDYKKYDELFPTAMVYEKPEILVPMAVGRLLYPYELMEKAREGYQKYVKEHITECGTYYLRQENWYEAFSYLTGEALWKEKSMDTIIQAALEAKQPEIVSFLMEKKRVLFSIQEKTFDL